MRKYTLSQVLNTVFYFKSFKNAQSFWKIQKRGFKTDTSKKDVLSYIASRNMRKTQRYNENYLTQQNDVNFSLSWLQFKKLFSFSSYITVLKLHAKTIFLRHLAKKLPQGKAQTKEELEESWGGPEAYKLLTFITNDFDGVIEKNESVLVFFSAYWCIHCLRLKKPFGTAALMAKNANLNVVFATFDVTINPDIADEKGVVGIPMIKFYRDGKYVSTFKGKRTADDLFRFAKSPIIPSDDKKNIEI